MTIAVDIPEDADYLVPPPIQPGATGSNVDPGAPYGRLPDGTPKKKPGAKPRKNHAGGRSNRQQDHLRRLADGSPAPPLHLPIPEDTLGRTGLVQDAARLYIHFGVTDFRALSRMTGARPSTVSNACEVDGWKAARDKQFAIQHGKGQIAPVIKRTDQDLVAIGVENSRQRVIAEDLQAQRDRIMTRIQRSKSVATPQYQRLLKTLEMITQQIEKNLGKDRHDAEVDRIQAVMTSLRAKAAQRSLSGQRAAGADIDDEKIIEMVAEGEMPPTFQ